VRKMLRSAVLVLACVGVTGCATNRGVLNVQTQVPPNPTSGKAVKIVTVVDQRKFEAASRNPSVPSLKDSDIANKAITERAIARKRNTYGKALGDILLPEGQTVEGLVRDALTRAFRESGYRVVEEGDATPIEVEVDQFWAWFTPGFWAASLEFEAKIKIKGDVKPFGKGESIRGYVLLHTQAAGTSAWMNIVTKGIENLVSEIGKMLGSGSAE
jgi:uncharacterized lipoprotein YajG